MSVGVSTSDREDFLRELYKTYVRSLQRIVLRATGGDVQWAEDVIQETMIRAWRHADLLRDGGYRSLLPWLTTVARNIVINDRRATREAAWAIDDGRFDAPAGPDPADAVVNRAVVTTAVARLTQPQRDVIIDVYLFDRALTDVARALRVPVGTVKSRTHHALRAMRARLSGQG